MLTTLINGDMKPRGTPQCRADRNLFIENCSLIQKTTLVKKQFYTRGGQILSFWVVEGQIQIACSGQSQGVQQVSGVFFGPVIPYLGGFHLMGFLMRFQPFFSKTSNFDKVMVQGMTTSLKQRVFCKNLLNKIPSFTAHTDCKIHNWPRTSIFKSVF